MTPPGLACGCKEVGIGSVLGTKKLCGDHRTMSIIQRIGIVYVILFWIGFPILLYLVGQSWTPREKTYWGMLYCCIALVMGYLVSIWVKHIRKNKD